MLKCQECHHELIDGDKKCPNCGEAAQAISKVSEVWIPNLRPRFVYYQLCFPFLRLPTKEGDK